MYRKNFRRRKDDRRSQAAERGAYRATLTPQQQLGRLNKRLGLNVGAQKERTRLLEEISNNDNG